MRKIEVLRGASFVVLSLLGTAAARPADGSAVTAAEWAQNYDDGAQLSMARDGVPVLSPAALSATRAAIDTYRTIAAHGGWAPVPEAAGLHVGIAGPAVSALRHRLQVSGDLGGGAGDASVYDSFVEAAVRHFQLRHGLQPTGMVSTETVAALDVPVMARLRQLQVNLVRLTAMSGSLGRRYVMANIPAAAVETVEDGHVQSHHLAGVGKSDRPSPVMQAKVVAINFNPYWHVPASIVRKDLIPRMRADPDYLTANHIHAYDAAGREVPPSDVDWSTDAAMRLRFREDPGVRNSMGVVRIDIANPYGVYMHDTATKGIFGDDDRSISSGCIRVQNVRDYVAWLLAETPGWDRAHIDAAIASGARIDARLAEPVPVYWVYLTAWATPDGGVQFRNDVYGRDSIVTARAGSTDEPERTALQEPSESR